MRSNALTAAREAKAIIEKAVQAHGGRETISRFRAIQTTSRGLIELQGGLEFIRELSFQSPDRLREVLHVAAGEQRFEMIRVYNGKQGWIKSTGRTRSMGEAVRDTVKDEIEAINLPRLLFLGSEDYELAATGESMVSNRSALGVRVSRKDRKDVNLYFDKETGLLAKIEQRTRDLMSGLEVAEEIFILEYQEVTGIQTTKKLLVHRDGKKYMEAEVLETTFREKLDDKEFKKP
jgi:hypothetical protein